MVYVPRAAYAAAPDSAASALAAAPAAEEPAPPPCPRCGNTFVTHDDDLSADVCTQCGFVVHESAIRAEVAYDGALALGVRVHANDDGGGAARRALGTLRRRGRSDGEGGDGDAARAMFRDRAGINAGDAARRRAEQARASAPASVCLRAHTRVLACFALCQCVDAA
jgi:hypothetical protein